MLCTSTGTCILLTVNGWSRCILIDIRIFPLGTSIGGNDMVAFFSVGVVNHITLHDLKLQSGHIYYATIKGRLLLIVTHCHVTLKAKDCINYNSKILLLEKFLSRGHISYLFLAVDFAGRTTVKVSDPVIVDTSPPVKTDLSVTITGRHIVSSAEIEAW